MKNIVIYSLVILNLFCNLNSVNAQTNAKSKECSQKVNAELSTIQFLVERKVCKSNIQNEIKILLKSQGIFRPSGRLLSLWEEKRQKLNSKMTYEISSFTGMPNFNKNLNIDDQSKLSVVDVLFRKKHVDMTHTDYIELREYFVHLIAKYYPSPNVISVCRATASKRTNCDLVVVSLDNKVKAAYKHLNRLGQNGVSNYIRKKLKEYNYDELSSISGHILADEQYLALGVFLELRETGNRRQKGYINAVERLFSYNTKRRMFSSGKHDLFMFFQLPYSKNFLKEYTWFLNEVANNKEANGNSLNEAYTQVLANWEVTKEKHVKFFKEDGLYQRVLNLKQYEAFN